MNDFNLTHRTIECPDCGELNGVPRDSLPALERCRTCKEKLA